MKIDTSYFNNNYISQSSVARVEAESNERESKARRMEAVVEECKQKLRNGLNILA